MGKEQSIAEHMTPIIEKFKAANVKFKEAIVQFKEVGVSVKYTIDLTEHDKLITPPPKPFPELNIYSTLQTV